MESKAIGPDSNHSPTIQKDNAECNGIEHGFCSQFEALLDGPECVNTHGLRFMR